MIFGKLYLSNYFLKLHLMLKRIIMIILISSSIYGNAQNSNHIKLIDKLTTDNFYKGTIDNKYISMYLNFNGRINPDFASVYEIWGYTEGWYKFDDSMENIPILGVLWGKDSLTLYVTETKPKTRYYIDPIQWDSIAIYGDRDEKKPLNIKEIFSLSGKNGLFIKNGETKVINGINFTENYLERNIHLEVTRKDKEPHTIDLTSLIETQAGLGKYEMVGLNGWADADIHLAEYTFVEDYINVLLDIGISGSCNTDASFILWVSINENNSIKDFSIHKIGNCKFYGPYEDKDSIIRIIPHDHLTESMLNPNTKGPITDKSYDLGSYKIINSKVIIINPWNEQFIGIKD